jgi:hypothetical protein
MFALAVQMVLSFGHMHRDDLGLPPLAAAGAVASDATRAPAHPAEQDHHPASDDYCPICAGMALVATAIPPLPPVIFEPAPIRHIRPAETPVHRLLPQVGSPFQARAPPLA